MIAKLETLAAEAGEGTIAGLRSGERFFKLDSHPANPVVRPQDLGLTWHEGGKLQLGAVFNPGAELVGDRVVLAPRCHRDYKKGRFFDERLGIERYCLDNYVSEIWPLVSDDGISFSRLENVAIRGDGTDHWDFVHGIEDTRIVRWEDRYLLIGCGKVGRPFRDQNADRIAVYSTKDFVEIAYHGIVRAFDSRNAIVFPEPIGGTVYMLFRFMPNIYLDALQRGIDQLLEPKSHEESWAGVHERREQNLLLEAGKYPHEKEKLGPGPQPIKTDAGWLIVYHAVGEIGAEVRAAYGAARPIARGYSINAALLDLENPRRVLCRTRHPIYVPRDPWELKGNNEYPVDVPFVVFPVGAIVLNGKLLLYAGAGDKYVTLLTCRLESLTNYLLEHCRTT